MARSAADWRREVALPEWDRALAAILLASCLVVPVLFVTAFEDSFALPKVMALRVILIAGLALAAIGLLKGNRYLPPIPIVSVPLAAFAAFNLLAFAFSMDRRQSLLGEDFQYQGLLTTLAYVGFFLLAFASLREQRGVRLLFASVATGGTAVACYALLQKAGLDPTAWSYSPQDRVFSSIGQPNALAAYLVLAIPVSAALLPISRGLTRGAVGLCLGLMVAALALTLSRGGYAGLAAAAAVGGVPLVISLRVRWRTLTWALVPSVAAVVVVLSLMQPARGTALEVWDRALSGADAGDSSFRMHRDLWAVGANIALDYPIVGAGQETYPELFPRYAEATLGESRAEVWSAYRAESPHNVYLAIAVGAGFPALAAYLAVIGAFVFLAVRAVKTARAEWRGAALVALLAAAAGHLVTDMFMTAEVTGSWLFWLLMGAGLAIARAKGGDGGQGAGERDVGERP